jgi:hypothetical protein
MGAAVLCDPVLIHTHILSETSCKMTRQNYPQNDRTPAKLSQLLICWNTHDAMNTLSSETRPPQRSQRSPQTYPRPSRCQSDEPIPDWEPDPDCPGDCDYPADSDDPTSTSTSTSGRTSGTSTIAPASAPAQQQHSVEDGTARGNAARHHGKTTTTTTMRRPAERLLPLPGVPQCAYRGSSSVFAFGRSHVGEGTRAARTVPTWTTNSLNADTWPGGLGREDVGR